MARSIYCSACKKEKEPGRDNESCCKACKNERDRINRAKKREAQGLPEYGTGRSLNCSKCKKVKEHRDRTYCNDCNNARERELWATKNAVKYNKREITLLCECGKKKESTQKIYCNVCLEIRQKESAKLAARERRRIYGSKVERGIHCSNCKKVKENQTRGYCLSCERERYYKRKKIDCAACGAIKENTRDSYCNECKRNKARVISETMGRLPHNMEAVIRRTTCEVCLSLGKCGDCLDCDIRKDEEKRFRTAVRRLTRSKIKQGVITKLPCEKCGSVEDVHAHHDDYYKPLDVRWLCRQHHREYHYYNPI